MDDLSPGEEQYLYHREGVRIGETSYLDGMLGILVYIFICFLVFEPAPEMIKSMWAEKDYKYLALYMLFLLIVAFPGIMGIRSLFR